jgi:hypothetical protein
MYEYTITGDRLLRHQLKDGGTCPLCSKVEESIDCHLMLLGCCYTGEVWHRLMVRRDLLRCCPSPQDRVAGGFQIERRSLEARGKVLTPWWSV